MKDTAIKDLKNKILYILREFPKSRESDVWLTVKLWTVYYPQYIISEKITISPLNAPEYETTRKSVRLEHILSLPKEDQVKRIRAKIQNEEHRYLPENEEVRKQRRISEENWKAWSLNKQKLFQ